MFSFRLLHLFVHSVWLSLLLAIKIARAVIWAAPLYYLIVPSDWFNFVHFIVIWFSLHVIPPLHIHRTVQNSLLHWATLKILGVVDWNQFFLLALFACRLLFPSLIRMTNDLRFKLIECGCLVAGFLEGWSAPLIRWNTLNCLECSLRSYSLFQRFLRSD